MLALLRKDTYWDELTRPCLLNSVLAKALELKVDCIKFGLNVAVPRLPHAKTHADRYKVYRHRYNTSMEEHFTLSKTGG